MRPNKLPKGEGRCENDLCSLDVNCRLLSSGSPTTGHKGTCLTPSLGCGSERPGGGGRGLKLGDPLSLAALGIYRNNVCIRIVRSLRKVGPDG